MTGTCIEASTTSAMNVASVTSLMKSAVSGFVSGAPCISMMFPRRGFDYGGNMVADGVA